jgi:glutamate synthase (NADPH/NADH) small chain
MAYLTAQNRRLMGEELEPEADITAMDKDVIVIGGGDTGSDCVGTALRQGARSVTSLEIMPRPPDERPDSTPWPMWPNVMRESSSHKEGGERRWCVTATSFTGAEDRVEKAHCVEVDWVTKTDERPRPQPKAGTEFELPAQLVLISMGFTGPGPNRVADELGLERDERGNITVDDNHMTSQPGVFSAGDMAMGQSLVVRAIADGRLAAKGILAMLAEGCINGRLEKM